MLTIFFEFFEVSFDIVSGSFFRKIVFSLGNMQFLVTIESLHFGQEADLLLLGQHALMQ